jgi:hypothetical protein
MRPIEWLLLYLTSVMVAYVLYAWAFTSSLLTSESTHGAIALQKGPT